MIEYGDRNLAIVVLADYHHTLRTFSSTAFHRRGKFTRNIDSLRAVNLIILKIKVLVPRMGFAIMMTAEHSRHIPNLSCSIPRSILTFSDLIPVPFEDFQAQHGLILETTGITYQIPYQTIANTSTIFIPQDRLEIIHGDHFCAFYSSPQSEVFRPVTTAFPKRRRSGGSIFRPSIADRTRKLAGARNTAGHHVPLALCRREGVARTRCPCEGVRCSRGESESDNPELRCSVFERSTRSDIAVRPQTLQDPYHQGLSHHEHGNGPLLRGPCS